MTTATFDYLERLGEGSSGLVYRARDARGQTVAVKLLRDDAATDPDMVRRFRREVELATGLEHQNLVRMHEGGATPAGKLYLASELVDGLSASQMLELRRPMPEGIALSLACDVLRALGYLHGRGLVHRDIKPENVLIGGDGCAKVSDFGLARSANAEGSRLTTTGEVLGTPYYMTPEQIQARKDIDIRADLYALGCMLYEWLTGERPFTGESVVDVLAAHMRKTPTPMLDLQPDLRTETVALVGALIRRDREDRPSDPAAVLVDAEAALAAAGGAGHAEVAALVARLRERAGDEIATEKTPSMTRSGAAIRHVGRSPRFKLTLTAPRGTRTLFVFGGDRLQLGRDAVDRSSNDVCLRVHGGTPSAIEGSKRIDSEHVRIELTQKGVTIKDLGTRRGTRVDRAKLAPNEPFPVSGTARIDIAGSLDLDLLVLESDRRGGPTAAALLTRPQNRSEHAYALVRDAIHFEAPAGEPLLGTHTGALLAATRDGFLLDGERIAPGMRVETHGVVVEVAAIAPEDMK